jgi:hypothetical protein
MTTYSITTAHADDRHASTHPEDRRFWIAAGCTDCRLITPTLDGTLPCIVCGSGEGNIVHTHAHAYRTA